MKSKKTFITITVFSLIVTAFCFTSVFAAENQDKWQKKQSSRLAIKTALNNNDYNAWLLAVGPDSQIAQIINQNNFPRLIESHNLTQQAESIQKELGIKDLKIQHQINQVKNIKTGKKAILNNDYQAFIKALPKNCPMIEKINKQNFSQLVEAHQLIQNGEIREAKEIMKKLDIKSPFVQKKLNIKQF